MWLYWCLFLAVSWTASTKMRPVSITFRTPYKGISGFSWMIVLILLIGFRHEVGGDWFAYLRSVENTYGSQLQTNLFLAFNPGYSLLNWIGGNIMGSIYLVNIFCAVFFSWGLLQFCKFQPRPELALLVAVPFLIIVVSMGYTRQSVAIGFVMAALVALQSERVLRFSILIIFASFFHNTAIIFLPFAIFYSFKNRILIGLAILISFSLVFIFLLQEYFLIIFGYYMNTGYDSSGAVVRVAMNVLPATIFLIWRKRFNISNKQRSFWTWMSWGALSFVPFLIFSPSSTLVDRLALYWIPLQLMVWAHAPDVLGMQGRRNPFWVYSIICYSGVVLFTWIFFADHRMGWLPYQFYPWIWFWS